MEEIQGTFRTLFNDGEGGTGGFTRNHYGAFKNAQGTRTVYRVKVKDLMVGDKVFIDDRKTPVPVVTMQDTYELELDNFDTGETETFNMIRFNDKAGALSENKIVQIIAVKKVGAGYSN